MKSLLAGAAVVLFVCSMAFCSEIYINSDGLGDYPTIQEAIDDANDGDVIILNPGIYAGPNNVNISYLGKAITVQSTEPNNWDIVEQTIIDGNAKSGPYPYQWPYQGLLFSNQEDANSILNGITIRNVRQRFIPEYNVGIICDGSSPVIKNCIIKNCDGPGIHLSGSNAQVRNCIIKSNGNAGFKGVNSGIVCAYGQPSSPLITDCIIANNNGSGILIYNQSPIIKNCTIFGNEGTPYYNGVSNIVGGGICILNGSANIENCTIVGNKADIGGGIGFSYMPTIIGPRIEIDVIIKNCIIRDNDASQVGLYSFVNSEYILATISISHSDIQGGLDNVLVGYEHTLNWLSGNIDADPCFVMDGYWGDVNDVNIVVEPNDPNAYFYGGDYHLSMESLCIDAGDPNYTPEPNETDIEGNPRVAGGRIDMGAYEFSPLMGVEIDIRPNAINLKSKGKWITVCIKNGEGYDVNNIDVESVRLENEISAEKINIDEQSSEMMLKFPHERVIGFIENFNLSGTAEIFVSGSMKDGEEFEGSDTVKIIDKVKNK